MAYADVKNSIMQQVHAGAKLVHIELEDVSEGGKAVRGVWSMSTKSASTGRMSRSNVTIDHGDIDAGEKSQFYGLVRDIRKICEQR